ncbi:MAG: hypothetical protein WCQ16_12260, partial [Verrucomicrobiae bacterium]
LLGADLRADPLIALPPAPPLSREAYQLILDFEVGGGRAYYERFLIHPEWPGLASGITVAIGYDCGYNSPDVIRGDFRALPERERLAAVSGLTGAAARARLNTVRDILVQWDLAEGVFNEVTIPRFWQLTCRTFPGFERLHPNAQGALLSLVFNRGGSLAGPGRVEMREIARLSPGINYRAMAAQVRAMKRLWPDTPGLLRRREAEARLLESCQ